MTITFDNFFWILVVAYAFYCLLIVPYFTSKSLSKSGESERFWFIVVALLNIYTLLYVILISKRKELVKKEKILFTVFIFGYFIFLIPIWLWMNNV